MSSITPHGPDPDSPTSVRPLPPRPNLEFERKQAKLLFRQVRAADPDALRRLLTHRRGGDGRAVDEIRLADAQFTIAREYGFPSWPRLVEYFTRVERHERSGARRSSYGLRHAELAVRGILAGHRNRRPIVGQFLVEFVPRFSGMSVDQVLASEITVEDARLVAARQMRCPSWDVLMQRPETDPERGWDWFLSPLGRAHDAIRNADLAALSAIVEAHPDVLRAPHPDRSEGYGGSALMHAALFSEQETPGPGTRAITDWLVARGADLAVVLNASLLRGIRTTTDNVRFLLERGADPAWLPPNGITVLEHAIIRYWNGDAVDLIASRVAPRKAFWIAAGLGDLRHFRTYFDRSGRLTDAARRHRPDFIAVGPGPIPTLPDADDLHLMWEAFFIAGVNSRFAVLDFLVERGMPIDYMPWEISLLHFAVGNRMVPLVEHLVSRGADVNLRSPEANLTAREAAEMAFRSAPADVAMRRMLEACGGDPDAVIASAAARPVVPVGMLPAFAHVLELALDEAAHLGQREAGPGNLLVALLSGSSNLPLAILSRSGADLARLRQALEPRLTSSPPVSARDLPWDPAARQLLDAARDEGQRRRHEGIHPIYLLWAIARHDAGPAAAILCEAGADLQRLSAACERVL